MPGISLSSWHQFSTVVTIINESVREMFALYVVQDVIAAFVLKNFPLFSTQRTSKSFSRRIFYNISVQDRAIRKICWKYNVLINLAICNLSTEFYIIRRNVVCYLKSFYNWSYVFLGPFLLKPLYHNADMCR